MKNEKLSEYSPKRDLLISYGFCWGIFLLLLVCGLYRIQFGLSFTDEGTILGEGLRYSLGDIPFRDEINNTTRMFDILLWPIFSLFPGISLFQLRCIGLLLKILSAFSLFFVFKKFCPSYLAAAATSSTAFLWVNVWSPGYNILNISFFFLSVSLWVSAFFAKRQTRISLSVMAGLIFFLSYMAYLPAAALIVLPFMFVLIPFVFRKEKDPTFIPSAIFVLVNLICVLLAVIIFYSFDLCDDWMIATRAMMSRGGYSTSLSGVFYRWLLELLHCLPFALATAAILLCLTLLLAWRKIWRKKSSNSIIKFLLPLATGLSVIVMTKFIKPFTFEHEYRYHIGYCILAAAIGVNIFSFCLYRFTRRFSDKSNDGWQIIGNAMLLSGILCLFIRGVASGNNFMAGIPAAALILGVGIVNLSRSFSLLVKKNYFNFSSQKNLPHICLTAFCIAYLYVFLVGPFQSVYRDAPIRNLTEGFRHPRLRSIKSTPERVKGIEEILSFLSNKIKPGDYFLAYYELPMFYYMTHTRPAGLMTWARPGLLAWSNRDDWQLSVRQKSVKHIIQNKRIPKYCIQVIRHPSLHYKYAINEKMEPLHTFVRKNYRMTKLVYPFIIWEHKLLNGELGQQKQYDVMFKLFLLDISRK